MTKEQKILARIKENDRTVLDKLYVDFRDPFINYFKKYQIGEEEIKDIYQDTMIAFYQKGVQGKLSGMTSSIKTYVFGIGKHKAIDFLRKKSKKKGNISFAKDEYEQISIENEELSIEQKKLNQHFTALGESCQKMLRLFYYRGLSIQEIVRIGNYKDANTVKSHKSRCVKQLRTLVNK